MNDDLKESLRLQKGLPEAEGEVREVPNPENPYGGRRGPSVTKYRVTSDSAHPFCPNCDSENTEHVPAASLPSSSSFQPYRWKCNDCDENFMWDDSLEGEEDFDELGDFLNPDEPENPRIPEPGEVTGELCANCKKPLPPGFDGNVCDNCA